MKLTFWLTLIDEILYFLKQFDINNDGQLDILFTTSSAELRFYTPAGHFLRNQTVQVI